MTTTPSTILRDTAIAGLLVSLLGGLWGGEFAGAVAAGAIAGLINLALLVRLVRGVVPEAGGLFLARLLLKHLAGAALLLVLVANLPAAPVFIGFCSVLLALSARALFGAGAAAPSTPSSSLPEAG
ncbi:MAG: hypothetical protein Q8P41_32740 [Pseudomonadota bacterium]|nr:hypothetical protein [Pseudomonadota bacterium]